MPLSDPWLPTGTPVPLGRDAAPITVAKYVPGGSPALTALPNLRAVSIEQHDGPDPGHARFRYVFPYPDSAAPQSVEDALGIPAPAGITKVVAVGDRLVVYATRPDATSEWLFDGFALSFGMRLGDGVETVEISAVGVAVRCWDTPIAGALVRPYNSLATAGSEVATQIPARFQPQGQPNSTGDTAMSGTAPADYPVFLDPTMVQTPEIRFPWTLPRAARFLILYHNSAQTYIKNPAGTALDTTLVGREAIGGTTFDPANPATYTAKPLTVADLPLTGRDWPTALFEIIRARGFSQAFQLTDDGAGHPQTSLKVYHPQTPALKDLWLQPRGSNLDLTLTNLSSAQLERDCTEVGNSWIVDGAAVQYEVSFILAPGFPMNSTDAAWNSLSDYETSNPDLDQDAYRLFVFDECGEGHYAPRSATKLTAVPSLDALFGAGNYTVRRRKPIGELHTTDAQNIPKRYSVSVSTDYAGTAPGIWDGTGTWQVIEHPPSLLHDRLGVRITQSNPNEWVIGESDVAGMPFRAGEISLVENLALAAGSAVKLRLTCVVEADQIVQGTAARRTTSVLPYNLVRRVDARDRFEKHVITASSQYNVGAVGYPRDDTELATTEAETRRDAADAGVLAGEVVIPRLTTYYSVGDRIRSIQGRGLGLRTDGGGSSDTPIYPVVIGRRFELQGGQRTILSLSDASTDRHTRGSKHK